MIKEKQSKNFKDISTLVDFNKKYKEDFLVVSVDPGVEGYVCVYKDKDNFNFRKIPYYKESVISKGKVRKRSHVDVEATNDLLHDILTKYSMRYTIVGIVEDSIPMPGQNVITTKSMVEGSVVPYACMVSLGIPCMRITAQEWKNTVIPRFLNKQERKDLKEMGKSKIESVLTCQKIFKDTKSLYTDGKLQDDKADALLIGYYLKLKIEQENR